MRKAECVCEKCRERVIESARETEKGHEKQHVRTRGSVRMREHKRKRAPKKRV